LYEADKREEEKEYLVEKELTGLNYAPQYNLSHCHITFTNRISADMGSNPGCQREMLAVNSWIYAQTSFGT
jgi:hypothetical protein